MMFRNLMVPLDGSSLAEVALPAARTLGKILNAKIFLVHLVEKNAPSEIHGDRHLSSEQEALEYLDEVAERFFPPDLQVECHVHETGVENVARSLVEHTWEVNIDMIVMCTHGSSGPYQWIFGSIAQQVINLGVTPVLLIHPDPKQPDQAFHCEHILVPLDGNPEHEYGLHAAEELAAACNSSMHLMMVVHTPGTLPGERAATHIFMPRASAAALDLKEEEGRQYLMEQQDKLQEKVSSVSYEIIRGDPSKTIDTAAQHAHADLIVMGTHGKTQTESFWSGSVTPRVMARTHLPMLLVPIPPEHRTGVD
jgi:nucleotide-binding universal stress UspA family protein